MGLSDITGVFSRYFVVGFFLPAYMSLVALWLCASADFIPRALEDHSEATQLLILGGVGLVAALALSGCSYLITRAFEGYPLLQLRNWPVIGRIPSAAVALQRHRYDRLLARRKAADRPRAERARAAWTLERFFPHDPNSLLPTRLGNAILASERHSNDRWGLDGVTIWPRIDSLLSSDERELHIDAKIDLYVFMNAALGGFLVGSCLVVDQAVNTPQPASYWPLYAIPFGLAYALYRLAVTLAANWGDQIRSSIDLHRLELYEKLGVRAPTSFSDERELAVRINPALLYGDPLLPDDLWRSEPEEAADGEQSGLLSYIRKLLQEEGGS